MLRIHYPGTGNYIVVEGGNKLFRYEGDTLYFWGGVKGEVSMTVLELRALIAKEPTLTANRLGPDGLRK